MSKLRRTISEAGNYELVLSSYKTLQISKYILRLKAQLRQRLTRFSVKNSNICLTIISIKMVFSGHHYTSMGSHTRMVIIFRHHTSIVKYLTPIPTWLIYNTGMGIVFVKNICKKTVHVNILKPKTIFVHIFKTKNHTRMITMY